MNLVAVQRQLHPIIMGLMSIVGTTITRMALRDHRITMAHPRGAAAVLAIVEDRKPN